MATYGNFTGITDDETYVYVAAKEISSGNQVLIQLSGATGITGVTGTVVQTWNASSYSFSGICWVGDADFYLCDTTAKQIVYFDGSTFAPFTGITGAIAPRDITSDGTDLYVALDNATVKKINISTKAQTTLVSTGLVSASYISYGAGELTLSDTLDSKIYLVDINTGALTLSRTFPTTTRPTGLAALEAPDFYFFTASTYFGYVDEAASSQSDVAGSTAGATGYQDGVVPGSTLFNGLTYMTNVRTDGPGGPGNSYLVDSGNAAIRLVRLPIGGGPSGPTGGFVSTFYGGAGGGGGGGGGGAPCFLDGSEILCLVDDKEVYIPVEQLRKGTLVKTSLDGYKKVDAVGKKGIWNTQTPERIQQRLYKLSPANYPELKKDLFLTGCHSILVDELTDVQRQRSIEELERIFVTDKKYRLIACVDERAEPWQSEGAYIVWHFALESDNVRTNYGVYANGGLLVESCSINYLRNRSNMNIL